MPDPTPDLTPEQRAELSDVGAMIERHHENNTYLGVCAHCISYWPCDAARLLVSLAEARRLLRAMVQKGFYESETGSFKCFLCERGGTAESKRRHSDSCIVPQADRYLEEVRRGS